MGRTMFISNFKWLIFFSCSFWIHVECLKVIPERGNLSFINPKYVRQGEFNVRRYGRKSPYYLNLFGYIEQEWNNNVTVDIIFSQFLHNEYRRSFVELHYKLCDLINNEPYVGGMLKLAGLTCPMVAGEHYFMNMSAPTATFPNVFPFEKGRVDSTLSVTATKETVLQMFLECTFKN